MLFSSSNSPFQANLDSKAQKDETKGLLIHIKKIAVGLPSAVYSDPNLLDFPSTGNDPIQLKVSKPGQLLSRDIPRAFGLYKITTAWRNI